MNVRKYIKEYGGKAGVLFYLRDLGGFEEYLVQDSQYFGPEIEIPKIIEGIDFFEKQKIVRGTTPEDFSGFVDVIATYNVRDPAEAGLMIEQVRESAQKDEVYSYAKYEGYNEYTGKIGILIQDRMKGVRGSMIEHPGEKGVYLIEHQSAGSPLLTMNGVVDSDGEGVYGELGPKNKVTRAKVLVALYQKVRESGAVPEEYSFQIEFIISDEKIYLVQVRLFRKCYQSQDFEVDGEAHIFKYHSFGVTPPEGLILTLAKGDDVWEYERNGKTEIFYALDNSRIYSGMFQNPRMPFPLDFQPKEMIAYTNNMNSGNFLTHGHYRWMQKSKISMFGVGNKYSLDEFKSCNQIRVISNGIEGNFLRV